MDNNLSSAESLSVRVRRTLNDLAAIRQSLLTPMASAGKESSGSRQLLDLELAAELKSVVDTLRRLLWAYIQALSAQSGRTPHEILEWYKMQLAVEMLRNVRSRSTAPASPSPLPVGAESSFEQLVSNALAVSSLHNGEERRY